jgi:hypothetical protein
MEALQYVADRREIPVELLTIPSQRRYVQYFSNVLDGVRPRSQPLMLRRIILNGIPAFNGPEGLGCRPYIQVFKNGVLLANASLIVSPDSANGSTAAPGGALPLQWISCREGSASFNVDCLLQGDILIRCRHADSITGARISMFRAAFHTGYVPQSVLRLMKSQLDGPNTDARFDNDFFIDLIFAPVERGNSNIDGLDIASTSSDTVVSGGDAGVVLDGQSSEKFEQMLHRDSRFWESVAMRKARAKRVGRKPRKFLAPSSENFSIFDAGDDNISAAERTSEESRGSHEDVQFTEKSLDLSELSENAQRLSDSELLMQLAQAESGDINDEDIHDGSSNSSGVKSKNFANDDTLKDDAQSELRALESFEKELGLDSIKNNLINDLNNADTNFSVEESLDDLEKYLQSLS